MNRTTVLKLLSNPRWVNARSQMPKFNLAPADREALADFVLHGAFGAAATVTPAAPPALDLKAPVPTYEEVAGGAALGVEELGAARDPALAGRRVVGVGLQLPPAGQRRDYFRRQRQPRHALAQIGPQVVGVGEPGAQPALLESRHAVQRRHCGVRLGAAGDEAVEHRPEVRKPLGVLLLVERRAGEVAVTAGAVLRQRRRSDAFHLVAAVALVLRQHCPPGVGRRRQHQQGREGNQLRSEVFTG
jgi:hypothetical protein